MPCRHNLDEYLVADLDGACLRDAYLKHGGTLEKAAAMANHASTRTTQLYDRRQRRDAMRRQIGPGQGAIVPHLNPVPARDTFI